MEAAQLTFAHDAAGTLTRHRVIPQAASLLLTLLLSPPLFPRFVSLLFLGSIEGIVKQVFELGLEETFFRFPQLLPVLEKVHHAALGVFD